MKNIVIDATSLTAICKVDMGDMRVIEWLIDESELYITSEVLGEASRYIESSEDEEAENIYYEKLYDPVDKNKNKCEEYADFCISKIENGGEKIDSGEYSALCLALRMCFCHKKYVIYVTDDMDAYEVVNKILCEHGRGHAMTGFEIIKSIGFSNRGKITINEIVTTLKSLNAELRNNSSSAPKHQEPDKIATRSINCVRELRGSTSSFLYCNSK